MALTYQRMLDKAPQGRDDSITLAADRFILSGLILFGARWKAPLAHTLGVSRETVSRWVSGGRVPQWANTAVAVLSTAKGSVLSLCDRTSNMVQPWAAAGFECFCIDTRHPQGEHRRGNITFIGADLREWLPPPRRYAIVFAFPPCTHTARTLGGASGAIPEPASGTRWFRTKGLGGLTEALEVVEACRRICEWSRAPWMIEAPVSTLGSDWREPDFTFHPHQFGGWPRGEGGDYSKRTYLWTGGGFRLPQQRPIPEFRPLYIHNLPLSDERGDLRSITPPGFARAVFEANLGCAFKGRA
jgi:hypothetical protein